MAVAKARSKVNTKPASAPVTLHNHAPAVQIGASPAAILAARDAIVRIVELRGDQETIREALRAFTTVAQVNHSTLSNFSIVTKAETIAGEMPARKSVEWPTFGARHED